MQQQIFFRRVLFSTKIDGGSHERIETPKNLYKYLIRQCNRLPNVEIQKYYRHQVKQSFNQHSDETDPERVNQIITQAVKDFDWVLKKLLRMENHNATDQGVQHASWCASGSSPENSECGMEFSICGPLSSTYDFFYAVSVFATRPHVVNRSLKGTELDLSSEEQSPKFFSRNKETGSIQKLDGIAVPEDIVEDLQEPFLKSLIQELKELGVVQMVIERKHVGYSMNEFSVSEFWDLENLQVHIKNEIKPEATKECPAISLSFQAFQDETDVWFMKATATGHAVSRIEKISMEFYKTKLLPKILKWATCNNSSSQDSHPSTAPGVPASSLKHVHVKSYYQEYKQLKDKHFRRLQSAWTETTDPLKFISEELSIGAYIKVFIESVSKVPFSFVDMGCGNGLLTFTLTSCGITGYGIDIRPRKLWGVYPQLEVHPDLRILSFNPFCDTFPSKDNLWLIGNHADELTPWISVVARRTNAAGYIVIPCCLFDFHGKFQRKAKNRKSDSDPKSLYQNYIHYIAEVGRKCGYRVLIDKLRIPSTKRVCIIGISTDDPNELETAKQYADSKVSDFPSTDDSISDVPVFKPRCPEERVNNLSQVDKSVTMAIVKRIFNHIIGDGEGEIVTHSDYGKPWHRGQVGLTLREASGMLTREEKDLIQKQGKGLQTLLKNYHQIFRIRSACITLRRPVLDDKITVSTRLRTHPCFYYLNHPDGCPLADTKCKYLHGDELMDTSR